MTDAPEFPDGEFDLIYADPPWSYDRGGEPTTDVEQHYDTMSTDDIAALDPPAADDCVLYLWSTSPHLPEAIRVCRSWGFEYKTSAVWDKGGYGPGSWYRVNHELLLVGAKGDASPPETDNQPGSVYQAPRGDHSAKPADVRRDIERMWPDARKLELFSRDGRTGWKMWGDEVPEYEQVPIDKMDEVLSR